jgi:glycosyltransferase involved in cell wall biosynthesis
MNNFSHKIVQEGTPLSVSLIIGAGSGSKLTELRALHSKKMILTEPHPQQFEKLTRKIRSSLGEEILELAVVHGAEQNIKLNVFNDLKFNSTNQALELDDRFSNIKKIKELEVNAKSLTSIISEQVISNDENNLLALNAPGQSSELLMATPAKLLQKFNWLVISHTPHFLYSNDKSENDNKTYLESIGFDHVANSDSALYPFEESLYRRDQDRVNSILAALVEIEQQAIVTDQEQPHNVESPETGLIEYNEPDYGNGKTSPQEAFDQYILAQKTGLTSFIVSACVSNINVGNFALAKNLIQVLGDGRKVPGSLMSLIQRKLNNAEDERKRMAIPDISVVIPYHNREKIIRKCLDSVLSQTVRNIEIIVVDDGSTDAGRAVVESINDERLVVINCDKASGNSGTPRNVALKHARGNYIAFVDSDDTIDEGYFEELLDQAKASNADITFSRSFTKLSKDAQGNAKKNKINYIYNPTFITDADKKYFFINSFVIWDKLYKRSFLTTHDIKLAESKIGADTLMVAKAYYHAASVSMCTNKAAYNYNAFSEGSVTQAYRSQGDIKEEDRPYAETFAWMKAENVPKPYFLIQWIRRLMSLSYCLSSSTHALSEESLKYLEIHLKEAPFKSALTHLKRKNLNDQYESIRKLMTMLGRESIHIQ